MSKKKQSYHQKNLSQQAIDLITSYQSIKLQNMNLQKKQILYSPRNTIKEEDIEESPQPIRLFSRTQHELNINIYNPQLMDDELQQDVQQLRTTLNQRIIQLKQLLNQKNNKTKIQTQKDKENKENLYFNH